MTALETLQYVLIMGVYVGIFYVVFQWGVSESDDDGA